MSHDKKVKDPRVLRTKNSLKRGLLLLMNEKVFEEITIKEITQKANVNRATFYLHYKDKYDLLHQSMMEVFDDIQEGIKIIPKNFNFYGKDPHPNYVHIFEMVMKHKLPFNILLVQGKDPDFISGLLDIFHELVAVGLEQFEPNDSNLNAPREIIVHMYQSAFVEIIQWWIENDFIYSPIHMAKAFLELTLKGPYKNIPLERNSIFSK